MNQKPNPGNGITPFNFWCQTVIPLIYDDSLSYYETLCKIKVKINEIIASQNTIIEAFKELIEWIDSQLLLYVDNKLEEWLDDGTLENLIAQKLDIQLTVDTAANLKNNKFVEKNRVKTLGFYNINDGGGALYIIKTIEPNTIINEMDTISVSDTLYAELIYDNEISVKQLGARNGQEFDSRPAFQRGCDLSAYNKITLFVESGNYYFKTVYPDNTSTILLLNTYCNIKSDNAVLIALTSGEVDNFILFNTQTRFISLDSLVINGQNLVNYIIKTQDFSPYFMFNNLYVTNAKNTAISVMSYISTLTKCIVENSPIGFNVEPYNAYSTSVSFYSCYANVCSQYGFYINGLNYSDFIGCGCDHCDNVGYHFIGHGLNVLGCGCENTLKPVLVPSSRGITLQGMLIFRCGNSTTPPNYAIEFVNGTNFNVSGIYFEQTPETNFNYYLGLTGNSYGFECVTILDNSISPANAIQTVSNYKYGTNAINYVINQKSYKDLTLNTTLDNLEKTLKSIPKQLNHLYTINVTNGSLTTPSINISNLFNEGNGRVIINFNNSTITGTQKSILNFYNCGTIVIENLTLNQTVSANNTTCLLFSNTKAYINNVTYNNNSGGAGGAAVFAQYQSIVIIGDKNTLGNGEFGTNNFFPVFGSYYKDSIVQNYRPTA
jgi:hypothetical protein